MADAVESMWWKVGVNYDGKPLEKFKKDLEDINDHVRKLNQPTSDGNAAITERLQAYRDLEKQVKKTAEAMANPKQSLEYHRNIGEHMKRQRAAIDAQVASYRDGGKAIEAFGQAQLKINDRGALIRQEQMNGAMRRHELATAKAHLAVSKMFGGMNDGSRDAIGRLDLMRANIEKLGRVALGAGLVGGTFGMMSSAAESVRQNSNAGFVANVSANDVARYNSQTKALGGNDGDGEQIIGKMNDLINKLHFGQLDSDSYRRFGMSGIDVSEFQRFWSKDGNHTMDAVRAMQQRLFEAHQRNPGLAKQAAEGIIPASAQQALLTRSQSDWDAQGAKYDAKTSITPETEEAQRKFIQAMTDVSNALDGFKNHLLVDLAPVFEKMIPVIERVLKVGGQEVGKFIDEGGQQLSRYQSHIQKYYSGLSPVEAWVNTGVDDFFSLFHKGSLDAGYDQNASINKFSTGMMRAQDGTLYDPKKVPGRPHDRYEDMRFLSPSRIMLDNRESRRAELRKRGQSTDTQGLKASEADDAAIMRSHDDAHEFDSRTALASAPRPHDEMKKTEQMRAKLSGSNTDMFGLIGGMSDKLAELEMQYRLPRGILAAQARVESAGNPMARNSKSGAEGLWQFMPSTGAELGLKPGEAFDPQKASVAAAKYMRQLLDSFGGNTEQALAAYNWGMGNVHRKGLDAAPPETQAYVPKVMSHMPDSSQPDSQGYPPSYTIDQRQYMPSPAASAPPQPQMQPLEVSVHIDARGSDSRGIEYAVERGVKQAMGQANMSMMASNFSTFKSDV